MNSMDTKFLNRIASKEEIYNLCLAVEADFYHQHHDREKTPPMTPHSPMHNKKESAKQTLLMLGRK